AFLVSLASAVTPGPILVVTIAKSIKSPWAGLQIAIAHVLIDTSIIIIIYFGLGDFLQASPVQSSLNIIGGFLIIWLGIHMFRSRTAIVKGEKEIRHNAFLLGILATLFNPMFLPWWLTIGSMFVMQFRQFGIAGLLAFIISAEVPNLIWYPVASIVTYKTGTTKRGWLIRQWLFVICSLSLIGFGIWFIYSGVQAALG
ncbi:MAG: LysE family transporter, partial [Chloroflexota bacterium]